MLRQAVPAMNTPFFRISVMVFLAVLAIIGLLWFGPDLKRRGPKVAVPSPFQISPGVVIYPYMTVEAPVRDQKVTLTLLPEKGSPVDLFLCLEKDSAEAFAYFIGGRQPERPLISRLNVDEEVVLTTTVPAGQPYVVMVYNRTKETTVSVKLEER